MKECSKIFTSLNLYEADILKNIQPHNFIDFSLIFNCHINTLSNYLKTIGFKSDWESSFVLNDSIEINIGIFVYDDGSYIHYIDRIKYLNDEYIYQVEVIGSFSDQKDNNLNFFKTIKYNKNSDFPIRQCVVNNCSQVCIFNFYDTGLLSLSSISICKNEIDSITYQYLGEKYELNYFFNLLSRENIEYKLNNIYIVNDLNNCYMPYIKNKSDSKNFLHISKLLSLFDKNDINIIKMILI